MVYIQVRDCMLNLLLFHWSIFDQWGNDMIIDRYSWTGIKAKVEHIVHMIELAECVYMYLYIYKFIYMDLSI